MPLVFSDFPIHYYFKKMGYLYESSILYYYF